MDELRRLLAERAWLKGDFHLPSGKHSDYFIDCKRAVLSARGHVLVGERLLGSISRDFPKADAVAGMAVGGYALASSVAVLSELSGEPLDALYIRKNAPQNGVSRQVEGLYPVDRNPKTVLLEDTVTTGQSCLQAATLLYDQGIEVLGVMAVVDRLEGAAESFEKSELPFRSLFTIDQIQEDIDGP